MGTPVSIPATVCYEGEGRIIIFAIKIKINAFQFLGLIVVQIIWRGKTFYGTLIDTGISDRYFII
jgi:hypothetical protein